MRRLLVIALLSIFAVKCSKPTIRDLDGKIKGKASLRLADGSTISRDDSEEYHPQIVTLSDGYLVLAFGSDRGDGGCTPGMHNIYITKSLTPYDGVSLPFFDTPRPLKNEGNCNNDPGPTNFAVVPNDTGVIVYFNDFNTLFIQKANLTDFVSVNPGWAPITNTTHAENTVIGANAAGNRLVTLDMNGQAYIIDPESTMAADPYGFGLDGSSSAIQVRQEISGSNDAYIAAYYGSTMATTSEYPLGPIFDFDISLSFSGLYLNKLGAFYSNNASGDLVLFSAYDLFTGSEDMYVVTSHTAGDLWGLVGYFGFDTFIPPAPEPNSWYTFDVACGDDYFSNAPGTCSNITLETTDSLNGSNYASLLGNGYSDLGAQNLGSDFTISAWVYIPNGASGNHVIISNVDATTDADGFKLYVDATNNMTLKLTLGDSSASTTLASDEFALSVDGWYHVAMAVNSTYQTALIYVDGAVVNFTGVSWTPAIISFNTSAPNLYWGSLINGTSGLTGYLENARIHLRELSPMEIMAEFMEY